MALSGARFIDVEGIRTRYFVAGDGPPVVLFHGGNFGSPGAAHCAEDFAPTVAGLSRRYRVFAIDRLGQGCTDNPKTDADYTMAAVVRHAHATLRALGLSEVNVVGHSRGGYVAAQLTVRHPALVRTCVVIDSNTLAPGVGRNDIVFCDTTALSLTREGTREVLTRYSHDPACVTDDWVDALVEVAKRPEYAAAVAKMEGEGLVHSLYLPSLEADKEELLRRIQAVGMQRPTLLAWGYDDPTASMAQGVALYRLIAEKERQSRFHVFNRAGHFCYREQPSRFDDVVSSFIDHP